MGLERGPKGKSWKAEEASPEEENLHIVDLFSTPEYYHTNQEFPVHISKLLASELLSQWHAFLPSFVAPKEQERDCASRGQMMKGGFSSLPPSLKGCCALCHFPSNEKIWSASRHEVFLSEEITDSTSRSGTTSGVQNEGSRCVVPSAFSEQVKLTLERGQTKLQARLPNQEHHLPPWPSSGQGE